ncbi:outer membrane lipoprotein carrier protein LolA [Actibacterium sp. MT2.3-13A]|uniref:LolA family protein n=1 Tax=Actibacterium sp. MT2.3-13A TaxID=2828332 RepID=UPI001BA96947|nr:outer membrane lipoprotein carrier protein LolA [Actibacterium sp. MT2.3-13A]
MKALHLILAPAFWAATLLPGWAEKIPLDQISGYLNSFTTAQAAFTQINADGSTSTGQLYIKRPGRVRFEYDAPDDSLVMAGGGQVAIFDAKSNQPPEQYPLKRTPLNLILESEVDLARAEMVVGHSSEGAATTVVAQDPEHPEYGTISLVFTGAPVQLRQWIITGEDGAQTTVVLGDMALGVDLSPRLFNIVLEVQARGLND